MRGPGRPALRPALRAAGLAVAGAGGGLLAWAGLALVAVHVRVGFAIVLGLALAATAGLLAATQAGPAPPPSWPDRPESPSGGFAELSRLEQRLSWGSVDADRFEQRLRPLLVQLAQERLRRRHGVESPPLPDRARMIVGDRLWQLMTAPPTRGRRPPTPRELAELVTLIERI